MKIRIGPATLVSAAFIGPGTVITCSVAGVNFGYQLAWALVFSIFTTIILQEMSGRVALVKGKSLSQILRDDLPDAKWRNLVLILAGLAIWVGNAAYQSGNITGASMGLQSLFLSLGLTDVGTQISTIVVSALVFILLYLGKYKVLEKVFISMVILMSVVFFTTLFYAQIDWRDLFASMLIPRFSNNSLFTVLGLIGTTVVPYNLFLHSDALLKKGWTIKNLDEFRWDLWIAIVIGGIISISILALAAATLSGKPGSLLELSSQLRPLLGNNAGIFFAIGIFCAGITSSITAPLAAAFTVCGLLGKKADFTVPTFRLTWISIVTIGFLVSLMNFRPLVVIQFAQLMNGLLLPILAIIIFILLNSSKLGKYKNSFLTNILSVLIIITVMVLSYRTLTNLF